MGLLSESKSQTISLSYRFESEITAVWGETSFILKTALPIMNVIAANFARPYRCMIATIQIAVKSANTKRETAEQKDRRHKKGPKETLIRYTFEHVRKDRGEIEYKHSWGVTSNDALEEFVATPSHGDTTSSSKFGRASRSDQAVGNLQSCPCVTVDYRPG